MDHVGNTSADLMAMAGAPPQDGGATLMQGFIADRPADASFVIDALIAGRAELDVDPDAIGISGHSFGGWTTLQTSVRDERIRAALPLAPAGGRGGESPGNVGEAIADALELDADRSVPTLMLVADQDTILPLEGILDLARRLPERPQTVVLKHADHFHFCDRVEQTHDLFKAMGALLAGAAQSPPGMPDAAALIEQMKPSSELSPGAHAYALTRGLGLAHFDAHLREIEGALALLAGDLAALMEERGVAVEVI